MKRLLGLVLSFASLIVSCETGGGKTTGAAYRLEVSANGRYLVDRNGAPFGNKGSRGFSTPGTHADGASDWVLVLEVK